MFRRQPRTLRAIKPLRNNPQSTSSRFISRSANLPAAEGSQRHVGRALVFSGVIATAAGIHAYLKEPIHNEALVNSKTRNQDELEHAPSTFTTSGVEDDGSLATLAWGSNAYVTSPEFSTEMCEFFLAGLI